MINDSENSIFPSYLGKTRDQVHGNLLEWKGVLRGGDVIQGDSGLMRKVFVLLARCTPCDIIGDPGFHSFPDQTILGLSKGLIPSRMSCGGVVVD